MRIEAEKDTAVLTYQCSNCHAKMAFPEWVAMEENYDVVVFECPECGDEGELDISDRPKTDVRLIVNGRKGSSSGSGAEDVIRT